jgi:hypothetical protein
VQEGLAVVEELDALEGRPCLVHDAAEQLEVEHAGLPRAGDAGFRRAAGLRARDVARGRAVDAQAGGLRTDLPLKKGDAPPQRDLAAQSPIPNQQCNRQSSIRQCNRQSTIDNRQWTYFFVSFFM